MKSQKKYYAYLLPKNGEKGITDSWPACDKKVHGVFGARYRGFKTKHEAEAWLAGGANYEVRIPANLEAGVYFDAGTGRGNGVEISVTDEKGKNVLHLVMPKTKINIYGKHLIKEKVTNNYGELMACKYALIYALDHDINKIFGDSKLVVDYWSKGFSSEDELEDKTLTLISEVKKLRKKHEAIGGTVAHISGDDNPADLGFHR